jgi:hypothetical protein
MFKKITVCHDELMKKVTVTGDKLVVDFINMSTELGITDIIVIANNGFRQSYIWGAHCVKDETIKYLANFAFVVFDEVREKERAELDATKEQTVEDEQ